MGEEGSRLKKRGCRSWGCGLMWTATAQLPGAVEAGKSSWSLPSTLGCILPGSWELNGFASAEENLSRSTCGTGLCRPQHRTAAWWWGRHICPAAEKWLSGAVCRPDIKKTINKWYQLFLTHMALTSWRNVECVLSPHTWCHALAPCIVAAVL